MLSGIEIFNFFVSDHLNSLKECINMIGENDGFGRKCVRNRESN